MAAQKPEKGPQARKEDIRSLHLIRSETQISPKIAINGTKVRQEAASFRSKRNSSRKNPRKRKKYRSKSKKHLNSQYYVTCCAPRQSFRYIRLAVSESWLFLAVI